MKVFNIKNRYILNFSIAHNKLVLSLLTLSFGFFAPPINYAASNFMSDNSFDNLPFSSDCNGSSNQVADYRYLDADGDLEFAIKSTFGCIGSPTPGNDCNDDNRDINSLAKDIACNGIDENCDGVDAKYNWYRDNDDDSFGDQHYLIISCTQPEGFVSNNKDCNDNISAINPDKNDIPCNGIDEDCNGLDSQRIKWYLDNDDDSFGSAKYIIEVCKQPYGYVSNNRDCDDNNSHAHPDSIEICDNIDNNCNGEIDENQTIETTVKLKHSFDDVEQDINTGYMYLNSSDLELLIDSGPYKTNEQIVGVRFTGINIPHNSIINSSEMVFEIDELKNGADLPVTINIQVEDHQNPFAYTSTLFDLTNRARYYKIVEWVLKPSTRKKESFTTPDLTGLIQYIIDHPGWTSNNSINFLFHGEPGQTGIRTFESFDGSNKLYLKVNYTSKCK